MKAAVGDPAQHLNIHSCQEFTDTESNLEDRIRATALVHKAIMSSLSASQRMQESHAYLKCICELEYTKWRTFSRMKAL